MKYYFDLDETICATPSSRSYKDAVPYTKVIKRINDLYLDNNEITIYTARGSTSGVNHRELTLAQLENWGVKYHQLIDSGKPSYDLLIDDKAISASAWRQKEQIQIVGFVASAFDLLHAGHCLYLQEARSLCDHLIAALHNNPNIERKHKNKPIQSLREREIQLSSMRYVDKVVVYDTEEDLESILKIVQPDIRILGSDAKDKPITGEKYCKAIYYHNRNHNFSSSELKNRIKSAQ